VGSALVGKKRGDKVVVKTPGGEVEMSITSVA
jgi:transcription elongation GreA/GreB family factor